MSDDRRVAVLLPRLDGRRAERTRRRGRTGRRDPRGRVGRPARRLRTARRGPGRRRAGSGERYGRECRFRGIPCRPKTGVMLTLGMKTKGSYQCSQFFLRVSKRNVKLQTFPPTYRVSAVQRTLLITGTHPWG